MRDLLERDKDGVNYRRMSERLEPAMLFLSLALLPLLLGPAVTDLSDRASQAFATAGVVVWVLFAVEFFYLLYLSPRRIDMIREHKLDALMVVLPMLRPLRLLRLATAGTALGRAAVALKQLGGRPGIAPFFRLTAITIVVCAGFTLGFEHDQPGSSISNFTEALWWSFVTCTTVGYGDFSPVTTGGRIMAGILMLIGIAGLSLITASVAAMFVEDDEEDDLTALRTQLDRIEASLNQRSL